MGSNISENGIKYLGEAISKCVTIAALNVNLCYNSIGDNSVKYLGEGISKCVSLTSLNIDLSSNRLGHIGANNLREVI